MWGEGGSCGGGFRWGVWVQVWVGGMWVQVGGGGGKLVQVGGGCMWDQVGWGLFRWGGGGGFVLVGVYRWGEGELNGLSLGFEMD